MICHYIGIIPIDENDIEMSKMVLFKLSIKPNNVYQYYSFNIIL